MGATVHGSLIWHLAIQSVKFYRIEPINIGLPEYCGIDLGISHYLTAVLMVIMASMDAASVASIGRALLAGVLARHLKTGVKRHKQQPLELISAKLQLIAILKEQSN